MSGIPFGHPLSEIVIMVRFLCIYCKQRCGEKLSFLVFGALVETPEYENIFFKLFRRNLAYSLEVVLNKLKSM